jgi:CheY-like chemotaxis protein
MASKPATIELDAGSVDVLVVADDPALSESLLECLAQEGLVAVAAANGAEALRLVQDRRPKLILLDLEMPVMNGWQFLERRRSDPSLARLPVIVLSGLLEGAAGRSDVAARLEKPVDDHALVRAIRSLLSPAPTSRWTVVVVDDD